MCSGAANKNTFANFVVRNSRILGGGVGKGGFLCGPCVIPVTNLMMSRRTDTGRLFLTYLVI